MHERGGTALASGVDLCPELKQQAHGFGIAIGCPHQRGFAVFIRHVWIGPGGQKQPGFVWVSGRMHECGFTAPAFGVGLCPGRKQQAQGFGAFSI